MKASLLRATLILSLITLTALAACGPAPAAQALTFVTAAPDSSPTATPFQPALGPTPTPFQPVFPTPTGTILPTPTNNPFIVPTATLDPAIAVLPDLTALPTLDPNLQLTPVAPLDDQETVNFLLIGSDRRPGGSFRTDTMVIAMLRPREGQVSLISIPRDLWVYIPDFGNQRINTAYQQGEIYGYPGGGPGLLKATILYNLGVQID